MSKLAIDFIEKEISLTIPYSSAQDMLMIIEVAQDAADRFAEGQKTVGDSDAVKKE